MVSKEHFSLNCLNNEDYIPFLMKINCSSLFYLYLFYIIFLSVRHQTSFTQKYFNMVTITNLRDAIEE